jgi:hypothetical protein
MTVICLNTQNHISFMRLKERPKLKTYEKELHEVRARCRNTGRMYAYLLVSTNVFHDILGTSTWQQR